MDKRTSPTDPHAEPEDLGPVLDFMRLLWGLDHALQSASKRMESSLGVTGPQRVVIRMVGRYPGVSAGRLASLLHMHPSTLTGILKRLVGNGALLRTADPNDARRARFQLTPKGQALNKTKTGTVEAAVRRALGKLDPQDLERSRKVLEMLTDQVGAVTVE